MTRREVLAGAGLLAGCRTTPEQARIDPALAPLIPPDTAALVGVRFDLLKKTALWERLFPKGSKSVFAGLEERTGFDVADDLYEAVYCLGGRNRLALIRGKFTDGGIANSGLEPDLKIANGQKLPYKGYVLQGREEASVTFFNSSVALAGRAAALRDSIDARNQKREIRTGLVDLVASLPHAAHVYLVSDRPKLPEEGIGGLKSVPFAFQWVKAHLQATEPLQLTAVGQAPSEQAAQNAAASLRGILSLVPLAGGKKPEWKVEQQSAQVYLTASMTVEAVLETVQAVDKGF